jgi:hypothetical protein
MFNTLRQFRALFQPNTNYTTYALFQSLADIINDSPPPDEATVVEEDSGLWKDYTAVGFDIGGNLKCLSKNSCWE